MSFSVTSEVHSRGPARAGAGVSKRQTAGQSWPGNVRELQNVIERSLVLANGHDRLGIDDLPPELQGLSVELQGLSVSDELLRGSFHESVRGFKRELVRSALGMHNGNKL